MSDMTDADPIQPVTLTCQIIVAALIMGVVIFLGIILLLVPARAVAVQAPGGGAPIAVPLGPELPLITCIAIAMGLANLALSFVVPGLGVARARREIAQGVPPKIKGGPSEPKQIVPSGDTARLLPVYQTQLIIGAALLEGGAFFAAIAFMLEHRAIAAGMAMVLLAVLAARFPTRDRIEAWLEQQLGLLQEERQSTL